jgi:hypothetical protein
VPCNDLVSRQGGDQLSRQDIGSRLISGLSYKTRSTSSAITEEKSTVHWLTSQIENGPSGVGTRKLGPSFHQIAMGGWLSGRPCQPIADTIVPGRRLYFRLDKALMRPQARKPPPEVKSGGRTNPVSSRCVVMRHRRQKSVGPMSNQRAHDFAICPALPLMPTALRPSEGPTSRKRATREDALRIAKAKISRRRSLKMQREAQKAQKA